MVKNVGIRSHHHISVHVMIFSVLVFLMCAAIFVFSSQDSSESSVSSGRIVALVSRIFFPDLSERPPAEQYLILDRLTTIIRKGAHFSEYTILAQLVFQLFMALPLPRRDVICAGCAMAFTVIFAATDEIHQGFVPGRAMMARDVLIDSLGALFGLVITLHIVRRNKADLKKQSGSS